MPGQRSRPVSVRVSGEWACFTRPEMKVERVTYQYPTPSAARGILEAICWHPQFRWVVSDSLLRLVGPQQLVDALPEIAASCKPPTR